MPRIMTIWLPRWPVQRRFLEKPELRKAPVFVCRRERRGVMTVVSWAWALQPRVHAPVAGGRVREVKIPPGMSLAEGMAALAIVHGSRACHIAEVDHDDPAGDRLALEQLARSSRRFAPLVAIEDAERPECLHVDVTGTADFFGGEAAIARTAVWTLAARGIHARVAIADTPAAAWAAAHHTDRLEEGCEDFRRDSRRDFRRGRFPFRRRRRWAVVPKGGQCTALASLPAGALRLEDGSVAQLGEVGVDSIGGVLRLPRKSLASRFAPQVSMRLAQFTGTLAEPLVATFGDELPQAAHDFDFPLSTQDAVEAAVGAVLERLVGDCVVPLAAQGKGITSLQVRFEAPHAPVVVDVGLFRPSASVKHIVDLVRLRLARVRLPREIAGIAVEVVSAGAAHCRQRLLFGAGAAGGGTRAAAEVGMLLDRLSGRLGRSAVFEPRPVADAQPEHAWVGVPPSMAVGRRPGGSARSFTASERRPMWMPPRPVRLEVVSVAPDGPPVRFRLGGQTHEVVKAHGPERIETAWWRGPTVRRDYYVVDTETGARFWLFRRLRGGGWFLHGLFG